MKRRLSGRNAESSPRPGGLLRSLRKQRGFTLRDVHVASIRLARRFKQPAFQIPPSRLHEIEVKEVVPSVYRMYTLACVYRCSIRKLLSWYNIPPVLRRSSRSR
jgi:transcriptional regulator with XRE-family HTH domain